MQNVPCNLCQSDNAKPYCVVDGYVLVKCSKCGLIYLNPRPDAPELSQAYSRQYHLDRVLETEPKSSEEIEEKVRQNESFAAMIINNYGSKGELLDVGCGAGFFLESLKRKGWSVAGVDVSEWASQFTRNNFQINVFTGTLDTINIDGHFKVVTLFHTLEHMPDPLASLKKIHRLVCDDGHVIIKGPNFASFDRLWHGTRWRGHQPPFHLYHFTPATYRKMLETAGFSIEKINYQYWNLFDHLVTYKLKDGIQADYSKEIIQQCYQTKLLGNAFVRCCRKAMSLISMILRLKDRDVIIVAGKGAFQ